MSSNNGLVTVKEAAEIYKLHISTIYNAIKANRIDIESTSNGNRIIKKLKKADIERVFRISNKTQFDIESISNNTRFDIESELNKNNVNLGSTPNKTQFDIESKSNENRLDIESISNLIQKSIDNYFETKQTQLMKPIEEQALYRLGGLEKENIFLRQKVETLIQELEQYKALPWQIEERDEEIKSLEAKLKEEKEILKGQMLEEKKEALKKIEEEKEEILKVYEAKLQEAEAKQIEISEAWKKELEQAKRPWYKFW
ncbi:MAG: helix-turn-helix domain-containing protein [Candidatus Eremiobacterota bacterium]